jgi:rare lipoprotein A
MKGLIFASLATVLLMTVPVHAGTGIASWYGGGEKLNRHTANGEVFNTNAATCAHRSLPMGTVVRVHRGGRSVTCRINDRGPAAWTGAVIDLTSRLADVLGFRHAGRTKVTYTVVSGGKGRKVRPI